MQVDVLDQTGKKVSALSLNETMFGAPANASLVAQAIRVRLANARAGTANTKNRSEVSGGGRKPWRQKGTGRARQGSIRAPQWRGGGIVHGPRAGQVSMSMPVQMRRKALFVSLSDKLRDKQLIVLDGLSLDAAKTRQLKQIIDALPTGKTALLVMPERVDAVARSANNLADVRVTTARVLHAYDIMRSQTVIVLKDSLDVMEKTFLNTSSTAPEKAEPVAKKTPVKADRPSKAKAPAKKASGTEE
jgi:large subunit ribosomal protein L4